jgi:hypothetical protein
MEIAQELTELKELLDNQLITEEEFDKLKSDILNGNMSKPVSEVVKPRVSRVKRIPKWLFAASGVAVAVVLIVVFAFGGTADFNKLFPEYASKTWCYIAKDGSYMEVDTNWLDVEDYIDSDPYLAIVIINEKLGFSSSVYSKMSSTRALDGRLTESNDKYTVSWTYHPNNGLEILYEKKQ